MPFPEKCVKTGKGVFHSFLKKSNTTHVIPAVQRMQHPERYKAGTKL